MEALQEFLNYTVFDIKILNIAIAIAILSFAILLKNIISKTILVTLRQFTQKTKTTADDKLLDILEVPIKFTLILLGIYFAKEALGINRFEEIIDSGIKSFATFIVFMTFYKAVDRFSYIFQSFSSKFGKKLSSDIENFIIKTLRVIIIVLGAMSVLQEWGINVSAFVASLGLVGMALALAAKDTAANLFGSLVLFTDRPFKIGDWVLTPNVEGIVEDIGIRSTKVRTFAQALVSVPNASMANDPITNWSRMGKRRIMMNLGVTYGTTAAQIENILLELRLMLKEHEEVHQETIMIHFNEFGASSLNIFCYFFTKTTAWAEYLAVREDINLKMMKIVQENDASFAFPSQSLYIESMPKNKIL